MTTTCLVSVSLLLGPAALAGGFGKFKVTHRAEGQVRNPATGAAIVVPAARKLSFMPAKYIGDALNAPADDEASAGRLNR